MPTRYGSGDESGVRLAMKPVGSRKVAFDPFPFDVRPCRVQLSIKRLAARSFRSGEEFRRAYFQAGPEVLEFELV